MGDDRVVTLQQALGENRQIVDNIDQFRAANFYSVVLSGASNYTSGQAVLSVVASSVVRIRPLDFHLQNRETSHMTVVFRDGGITGSIVAGPYIVNPIAHLTLTEDMLRGRRFVSGIYAVVISGTFSAGIQLNGGYVLEPDPNAVGGYLT